MKKTDTPFKGIQALRIALKAWTLQTMMRLVSATWKLELIDPEDILGKAARREIKAVFPVFHHSYLISFHATKHKGYVTLTADNEAGEVLTRMIDTMGFTACRVSADDTARTDARAAIKMIELLRNGAPGAIAVDGPSGPYEKVKPGIFTIAQKSGAHIYPGLSGSRRKIVLNKRWDKFKIPLPFTKIVVMVGPEFIPTMPMTNESLQKDCERLEKVLQELTVQAEAAAKK